MTRLQELIRNLDGVVITGDDDPVIEHLDYDSRLIKPESLFFAVTGFKLDGYDFVDQAVKNGAVAVMGERETCEDAPVHIRVPDIRVAMAHTAAAFYGFPGKKLKACGVTGTNGKTTVALLTRNMLENAGHKSGLICSTGYDTRGEKFKAERTTPESLDIQRLLLLMKQHGCSHSVIEASSHGLVLHRLDHIDFRVAVYTNITRDHLDFHKSMEDYLRAKALLIKMLNGKMGHVVINLDVPEFRQLIGSHPAHYVTYSLENDNADIHCGSIDLKPTGTTFDLVTPIGTRTVMFPLPGRFNLINALAAAGAGLAFGIEIDQVVTGLETAPPVPGRFAAVEAGQPFGVYVDFAHTPDAIKRLCQSARELTDGRLLILFGCGGDRDRGKRPLMGKTAVSGADYAVVTSDNPRSEEPQKIIKDIKPGLKGGDYEIFEDRREAIGHILSKAQAGDVVLLAGKGNENYQEIGGVRHPFDDTAVAREFLNELGYVSNELCEEC